MVVSHVKILKVSEKSSFVSGGGFYNDERKYYSFVVRMSSL